MNTIKEFIEYIASENKQIVCFGTGLMAEEALAYPEIRARVDYFCDNDEQKQNRQVLIGVHEYEVFSPEFLRDIDMENTVILITSGYYKEIREQIHSLITDPSCDSILYDFPVLKVMLDPASPEFFEERILKECMKEYEIVLDQHGIEGAERAEKRREKDAYIRGQKNAMEPSPEVGSDRHLTEGDDRFLTLDRPFVVPRVMIMPTTRCNLRCKGCSSLLPLFQNPQDVAVDQILRDCDHFFGAVDECIRLTVGGEPFLYPDLDRILKRLIDEPKLLGIMLITNGMKVPDEALVPLLQNKKILVEISDYGRLEQMSRVVTFMEKNHINFKVLTEQMWTDMGGVEKRGRAEDEIRFVYLNCDQGRVIKGMHNGRFHTCARSARMLALGTYDSDEDYFELDAKMSSEGIRKRLHDMYYSDYADACDHCDLGALPTRVIEAGIQMNGNMEKSDYTIVKRDEYERLLKMSKIRE